MRRHDDLDIERVSSETLDLPATRPGYSVLDCGRLEGLGIERRPWQAGLADHLDLPLDAPLRGGVSAPLEAIS